MALERSKKTSQRSLAVAYLRGCAAPADRAKSDLERGGGAVVETATQKFDTDALHHNARRFTLPHSR